MPRGRPGKCGKAKKDQEVPQSSPPPPQSNMGSKKRNEHPLLLECFSEPLSSAQMEYYNKTTVEYENFTKHLDAFISSRPGMVIEHCGKTTLVEFISDFNKFSGGGMGVQQQVAPPAQIAQPTLVVPTQTITSPTNQIIMPNTGQQPNYQFVMDPRLGLFVGNVATTATAQPTCPPPPQQAIATTVISTLSTATSVVPVSQGNVQVGVVRANAGVSGTANTVTSGTTPSVPRAMRTAPNPPPAQQVYISPLRSYSGKAQGKRPREANSVGGIMTSKSSKPIQPKPDSTTVVDLTEDEVMTYMSDSQEVSISKMTGKTFPSLVVVARAHLNVRDYSPRVINHERMLLDSKVKKVLMVSPSQFTEWLLQSGLLRCEQYCASHVNTDNVPVKLKLGMYSDASKFPFSGGYVWISDCCPSQFVSVFSGSLFEGAPHPPNVILKLLYHWVCHTSIQNVVQWVKVDNLYVKTLYTNLRAVCTAALHQKYEKMGGNYKSIQVGVISLGTTTQDGHCRQVKVEVLGVLDAETKQIRIRAIEPVQEGERNYKKRFMKILEPLQTWVEKDSIILTDFTVDKGTLHNMGYTRVTQSPVSDKAYLSNQGIMEYLRKIVPRMFQNTLSLLSRQIIQQFLDELVWREQWGSIPSQAFDSIVEHIAEQTKLDTGGSLVNRLAKISANPFKNWKYERWALNCKPTNGANSPTDMMPIGGPIINDGSGPLKNAKLVVPSPIPQTPPPPAALSSSAQAPTGAQAKSAGAQATPAGVQATPAGVQAAPEDNFHTLEHYYYGSLPGDSLLKRSSVVSFQAQCILCKRDFKNNIKLMDHLLGHIFSKDSNSPHTCMCKYCCKLFASQAILKSHIKQVHVEGAPVQNTCQICSLKLRDKFALISHMTRTHYELEMPYVCEICQFRTSFYETMVFHFYKEHKDCGYGICPYCFKVVAFFKNGQSVKRNQLFYVQHIQKHLLHNLVIKCWRCAKWFINKNVLEEHQANCHFSGKHIKGVTKYSGTEMTIMPAPICDPVVMNKKDTKAQSNVQLKKMSTVKFFCPSIKISAQCKSLKCAECEADISDGHFVGEYSCTLCSFKSCCHRAMLEHNSSNHLPATQIVWSNPPVILDQPLFCPCSYTTFNGHHMAHHLVTVCKRTTCYLSVNNSGLSKNSANFPPLVNLDKEDENKWLLAYGRKPTNAPAGSPVMVSVEPEEPKTILNLLGLVRKSSSEEVSQDSMDTDQASSSKPKEKANELNSNEIIEIMDVEENEDSSNKMMVDKTPSPEPMIFD